MELNISKNLIKAGKQQRILNLFTALAALTILTACSSAAGSSEPSVANLENEVEVEVTEEIRNTSTPRPSSQPENTATSPPEATPETEEETIASADPEAESPSTDNSIINEDGLEISTVDDRSSGLKSWTASWNTNWELHTVDYAEILSGGPPRDGIPSIDNPRFIAQDEAAEWLAGNEPVIAVDLAGDARAYPLQILTWHEIVNDTIADLPILVTFCPLCNSAIVFERLVNGEPTEFGTSGLLRHSDLIMYDRQTESLWQQFTGEAIVGDQVGNRLTFLPSSLISFDDFKAAYPEGVVLSKETGMNRPYGQNPYVGYDTIGGQDPFLFLGELDGRLPAVERVVTVSLEDEGIDLAYPLSTLSALGTINDKQGEQHLVVFHADGTASALGAQQIAEGEDVGATGVFDPTVAEQILTFSKEGSNQFIDAETGSTWNIAGQAIEGPLTGTQLTPIIHGDHFWFSWAAFKPDTIIYQP